MPQALQSAVSTTGFCHFARGTLWQRFPCASSSASFGQTRPHTPQGRTANIDHMALFRLAIDSENRALLGAGRAANAAFGDKYGMTDLL
jgi:hypothetical protein